ncbi:Serine carboxypeptidase-like 51 [Nymphaea thermarum]|nr:Serine carboxypeptidase-like 51 [Nymphaea thermarum]
MEKMTTLIIAVEFFCLLLPCFHGGLVDAFETDDKTEEWGYVEVRPKAHMFWWLYRSPYRVQNSTAPWPIVLWLQGGPGASGVGIGNFQEIGPLDADLKPRNSTWLRKADLLFVDNPVGTGYSYVEDKNLTVKTDEEAATDLITLLITLFNSTESLQRSTLYIVAESYGGKHAVTLGLSVYDAIKAKKLKATLGGVALGDSWISPEDFVLSWGPLLKDVSRLDIQAAEEAKRMAAEIRETIGRGQYIDAVNMWSALETFITSYSNNVNFYNFLLDSDDDILSMSATALETASRKRYRRWGGQSDVVFNSLAGDFMKPRVNELDLICSTKGAEAWVQKLK